MIARNFFDELKRRSVYKVAVAYIDNRFDSLSSDPRFQKLLAKFMGKTK
jgi:hypothetical protein